MSEEKAEVREVPPHVLAMILCDYVHRDRATGKCTLIGTFSACSVPSFPANCPSFWVYIALTDVRRKLRFQLRIQDAASQESRPVLETPEFTVAVPSPLGVAEFEIATPPVVTFPKAGLYKVQLWTASQLAMERGILVRAAQPEKSS